MGSSHDGSSSHVAVLVVPLPAQGHLNQLLQFSCLVSSYNLPVYFVAPDIHNHQVKSRANGVRAQDMARIHFHDMMMPPIPPFDSDLDLANHIIPWLYQVVCAMSILRQPFAEYLQEMSHKYRRVIVVHDNLMSEVVKDVASTENAVSYVFRCVSASYQCVISYALRQEPPPEDFPNIPYYEGCLQEQFASLFPAILKNSAIREGDIHNNSRLIEGPYLEFLERKTYGNRKSWAIGPMVSKLFSFSPESMQQSQQKCFQWLDSQEPNSVIYVSFGTTSSFSNEQIHELAFGLEQSKVKFLWVLRDADKPDTIVTASKNQVPELFEERIKGAGLVFRDWAPQPEILNHPSVGGFMSHCGWNSCIESIAMGVPIAAWPMHSDQPTNTLVITEVLKMGVVVRDWSQRKDTVKASTIENAVRRLMVTEEGRELRKRAQELAVAVKNATQPGGASQLEMDSFIAHITR